MGSTRWSIQSRSVARSTRPGPLNRSTGVNGCERDLARLVQADRVLIGAVDKVSTLIGSLRLRIVDVATGQSIFSRVLGFRGDTDEAWQRAARFLSAIWKRLPRSGGERVRDTRHLRRLVGR